MKRRQLLKAVPFFTSLIATTAYAQNQQTEVARLFNIAAAKHKRELSDLLMTRGVAQVSLPDVSSQSIARVLSAKTETTEGSWMEQHEELMYPDKTSVLFYSHDGEDLQTWLVGEDGIQSYHRQAISKQQIQDAIISLRNSLDVDTRQRSRLQYRQASLSVVSVNAEPLEDTIANLTDILLPTSVVSQLQAVRHLVVVPILEMGTVPYAILKPFGDEAFLIDKMSVSIASSLFDLGQSLDGSAVSRLFLSPLVVGNPYVPESEDWLVPSLPGAEQEAEVVAEMLGVTPLLRREATKREVVSKVKDASLLYFAAHGASSNLDPLSNSFLMLSAESFEQGWWTAQEIQDTRLNAEVAVLSACQTGLGQAHDAGVIGLSRAFQIAGVPRVIMSLWNVDDLATSELMQAFMHYIRSQLVPAEALRQAMLEVRERYSEPYKWASFVLFGTPR